MSEKIPYIPIPGLPDQNALVPAWLVKLAAALAAIGAPASVVLPHPWSAVAGVLALVAAFLAGVPLPQPNFTRPLVPLALVPVLLSAGGALATFAASLSSPGAQSAALLGAALCFGLAGKALPQPTR
jgi:hypothetical protein